MPIIIDFVFYCQVTIHYLCKTMAILGNLNIKYNNNTDEEIIVNHGGDSIVPAAQRSLHEHSCGQESECRWLGNVYL